MDIVSMNVDEISDLLRDWNEKPFRAKQIFEWIHKKNVLSFEDMTNLSKQLREKLSLNFTIENLNILKIQKSKIDNTLKYLFALSDENAIETVVMNYEYGNTVCISSQVGCKMGCTFCASTVDGFVRNLKASEMLEQIYCVQKDSGIKISNVVVMGTGEPFDNFDNLIRFIEILNSENGLNIGQRHISISTCGIPSKIRDFADLKYQTTLAISLHAPNDEIRKSIMPVAKSYSINEILDACKYYIGSTNRRITFEYSLICGVNDSGECAKQLGQLLRHMLCHVNLIPVNEIDESVHRKSNVKRVNNFAHVLESFGIETTVRKKLGADIDAACGQLRRKYLNNYKE